MSPLSTGIILILLHALIICSTVQGLGTWEALDDYNNIVFYDYVKKNPSSCCLKNIDDEYPLHVLARKQQQASANVVRLVYHANPLAIMHQSGWGNIPLNLACLNGASFEVIQFLITMYPQGVKNKNKAGENPLSNACARHPPLDVIKMLVCSYPDGLKEKDDDGDTPLDVAKFFGASNEIIEYLASVPEDVGAPPETRLELETKITKEQTLVDAALQSNDTDRQRLNFWKSCRSSFPTVEELHQLQNTFDNSNDEKEKRDISLKIEEIETRLGDPSSAMMTLQQDLTLRCSNRPPIKNADRDTCASLVKSIMTALENDLDEDIQPHQFSDYYDSADFNPSDGETHSTEAVFWPPSKVPTGAIYGGSLMKQLDTCGANLKGVMRTVETTPGGALLDGIAICGYDRMMHCTETSGATSSFWRGAYLKYATSIKGKVRIIVTEGGNLDPLITGAVPSFHPSNVTEVEIYAHNCKSKSVSMVMNAIASREIPPNRITCSESMSRLICELWGTSELCRCLLNFENPAEARNRMGATIGLADIGEAASFGNDASGVMVLSCLVSLVIVGLAGHSLFAWVKKRYFGYRPVPHVVLELDT